MWEIIISGVIGLISGGSLLQLVTWKAGKKKADLDNDSVAVNTMKDVIDEIRKSNDHFQEINNQRESKIENLRKELDVKNTDFAVLSTYVCAHLGCSHRCPLREQATKWIQDLKEGKADVDYKPM